MQYQPNWSDIPAWVQAIGSILAIFVAIWISWRSDERARRLAREERDRVTAIARNSLLNIFKQVKWEFEINSKTIEAYAFQASLKDISILRHKLCADVIDAALIRREAAKQLDATDAMLLNDAFATFESYNRRVEAFIIYLQSQHDPVMSYVNPGPSMRPMIDLVKQACAEAIDHLSGGKVSA